MQPIASAVTFLFVPGSRPDRFDKAVASGADVVVLDLEDAVAPDGKAAARAGVLDWLAAGGRAMVRVNGTGTPWHAEDVAAVAGTGCPVMLPKAESGRQLAGLAAALPGGTPIVPLIETARGVRRAEDVCGAPGVVRPAFGSVDLAVDLGVDHTDDDALRVARCELVLSARSAGVTAPIDGVTTAVRDADRLRADTAAGAALGMTAKLCIHPAQIDAVAAALRPTAEQLTWARAVVEAAGAGAVAVLDGALVDKPVVDRARALLARAGERPTGPG
ncbi:MULTISPECIES: HpcH/HpaI aldolase/citrate lyase family protein [Pseudonocardia]|uniref:Citrate lyase subunit beta-like protein n=2 Tax=Pseudonocardia TaxID=1847 RepID=A0A1Y2MTM4_PSEAH|nr:MULTISPECIES: CoA ester lyase [Pseudonocardia]OSY38552.1 Citrate lyase subunit beta-like protein [Pseudonocardia autotrophica]TDN77005.1 citrate lyase subunit beta/citryl-CoA lyase [Pseudonocardia autotrophica]BBG01011.1 CoA ester lyase [Pseudonocardia autotrophica]GEC29229.1 CoA ester lyase [Pseudonocardia saturnea]